ncbi:MAG: ankyrin repeat domain-containing protein [Wolbachia sp.]
MRFSKRSKEEFNNWWKELVESSYENINKRDKSGSTVLHYAVGILDQKKVRLLIEKGADINAADAGKYRPLHLAVMAQRVENIKELIRSGAEVNVEERGSKLTPLHLGCMIGEKKIVEELVKAGASVEQKDKFGKTAIDHARNDKKIIEILKNHTIANKQKEFIEKVKSVSEKAAAGVIVVRGEPIEEEV